MSLAILPRLEHLPSSSGCSEGNASNCDIGPRGLVYHSAAVQFRRTLMRRSITAVFSISVLLASLAAQSDQWQKYTNRPGNFAVLMPVQPTDTKTPNATPETHTIQALASGAAYTVV